jgi:predicted nucleic acid-binding protein
MLVIETASGIARATNQSAIAIRAAHQLYTLPFIHIVPIDQHLVNEAANIAATYRLRGADSIFVALAKIEAVPLVSFDQVQLTRPMGVIATIRP